MTATPVPIEAGPMWRAMAADAPKSNPSGINPADVKVLVRPDPVEEKTTGGVFLPDAAKDKQKYATVRATLIAKGPNAFLEWGPSGDAILPGSRIIMAQYAGMRAKGEDGTEYVLINDEDVVAVLDQQKTEPNG